MEIACFLFDSMFFHDKRDVVILIEMFTIRYKTLAIHSESFIVYIDVLSMPGKSLVIPDEAGNLYVLSMVKHGNY